MLSNTKKAKEGAGSKKAATTAFILAALALLTIIAFLATASGRIQELLTKEPERKHVSYLLYGCTDEKSVVEWIEDGWTVTDIYWDSCGNINVELEK